jgi:sigma-B regulation protein RsbU (phosphoserine phosphatase)
LRIVSKYSLLFLLGISTWIPLLIINFYYWVSNLTVSYAIYPKFLTEPLRLAFYAAFFICNYILIDQVLRRIEKWDVIDLLWKLVVIGISTISVIFLCEIIEDYMETDALFAQVKALSVSIKLYALLIFCLSTLFIYRKLILYQKNKRKVISWHIMQVVFLLGLVRLFLSSEPQLVFGGGPLIDEPTQLEAIYTKILIPVFFAASLLLSANVNWSAYLNFNQKLRSLFLILIIVLLYIAFYQKFPYDALPNYDNLPENESFGELLKKRYLILALFFMFPIIYTLISGLVLIFNLPTSSVFEQRSSELATIQRINQSIQSNLDSEEILRTLLDASLLTSNATGGWIEIYGEDQRPGDLTVTYSKNVEMSEIEELRRRDNITRAVIESGKYVHIKNIRSHKHFRFARTRIRSLLALPIMTTRKPVGVIYLLNELAGSFEEATVQSLVGLTEQSGISIENAELVARSIDLEVYREQLKIAKTFQKQILPQALPGTDKIEFFIMSQEADEIGGDFYDVTQHGHYYKIAIGDVSGKGTTAAFYMAETKGIFQALTQLDMGVRDFIINANKALGKCLRKGSFMTLTYVQIDMDRNEIELLRAGHCETLYYDSQTDNLLILSQGGPGLGIVRNDSFGNLVGQPEKITPHPGDLLILYTDGIIEARNEKMEEFSFGRLMDIVKRLRKTDSRLIVETLVSQVKAFTGGKIEDDYSILVIKFL